MSKMDFLMIPVDAMFNKHLTLNDLRVLAAITFHDRRGANGRGCFATNSTLAVRAGCDTRTVKRALSRLRELGYVRSEHSAHDGRRFVHRVVYRSSIEEKGDKHAPNSVPDRGHSETILGTSHQVHLQENQDLASSNQKEKHILLNREADAVETASSGDDANLLYPHAWLAIVDRNKETASTRQLERCLPYLEKIMEGYETGDPVHGRAFRLCEEIGAILYERKEHPAYSEANG
ncbi:helix-turn-helix domain-containing protein [Jiella marina]|uniref:helix-turn-helix domain-containing protein n=1 Tax=Jiella sp. LLJ827 TaxID=2917712 RepID=UPI0021006C23|nr:helix-turn-helix domain-containing protein [Jiella sp. LLJ827]MCQ0990354.1 helix-turn-helix domain-containing protein [Jiella sp. LLJ827]